MQKGTKGRSQKPHSRHLRQKRAVRAAQQRWKHKQRLVPGNVLPWHQRSLENAQRHLDAAHKGGATTARKIKEQQTLFWNWYYGGTKVGAAGPFKIVIDTFERIEQSFDEGDGLADPHRGMRWDGFMHYILMDFVCQPMWRREAQEIEQAMWQRYEQLKAASEKALLELLEPLMDYEERLAVRRARINRWRKKRTASQA